MNLPWRNIPLCANGSLSSPSRLSHALGKVPFKGVIGSEGNSTEVHSSPRSKRGGQGERGIVILGITLALAGCNQSQTGTMIGAEEGTAAQLPALKVDLPPSPSFNKEHAPEVYSDGSYSVYGIRKNLKDKLNQPIRLRALVLEVYECPEAVAKSKDQNCLKPHLWVADRANTPKDKAMMVVDYPEKDPETNKKLTFQVGAITVFSGTFSKTSPTGFNSSDGLLVFGSTKTEAPTE